MILKRRPQREIQPLPFRAYWSSAFLLCVAGICICVYLAISHYRVHTDIGYQSFCVLSKSINCDTVSQSPFAVWWGMPLAVWGLAAYSFILILVVVSGASSAECRRVWTIGLVAAFGCSLASLVFAGISALKIGSWCVLCIVTYGINIFLFFLIWIIRRRFRAESLPIAFALDLHFFWSRRRWSIPAFAVFGAGLMLAAYWFPAYWESPPRSADVDIKAGLTSDGHPWIGTENPSLEIVEFIDYQCFQCRKMHHYLREFVAKHPEKIRLIHRNYPMDHEVNPIVAEPFHVGSGQMALLAIHAAASGKFLEVNDLLYSMAANHQKIRIAEIAERSGMDFHLLSAALQHAPYKQQLLRDIRAGMKLGIAGTPSYLINGRVYEGNIPVEILRPFLKAGASD